MDSDNWRTKRSKPITSREHGELSNDGAPPSRGWNSRSSQESRIQPQTSSFGKSGSRAVPAYQEKQPSYRGGPNPARGPYSNAAPRPRVPIIKDPLAEQAIDEGRRLYVGNLPYDATVNDIRGLFADISHNVQDISMSIDPMTGRNPSYCFVDFTTKEDAEETMQRYNGMMFMTRPLKVKPGIKHGTGTGRYHVKDNGGDHHQQQRASPSTPSENTSPYAFDRWRRLDTQIDPKEMTNSAVDEERRLFVGGLPRFPNQATINLKMQELFEGYNVEIVGKMISPHESIKETPGNHYYCFVDLLTKQEAEQAAEELNGMKKWNWTITVAPSLTKSRKLHERQRVYLYGLPKFTGNEGAKALKKEVRQLLEEFGHVEKVSEIFTRPRKDNKDGLSNRCYCFIEFRKAEEADAAARGLDGVERWGGSITVRASKHRGAMEEEFARE